MTNVTSANISFKENGTPVSSQFDDVYFCKQDGLAESQYVFLQQNKLPERFTELANQENSPVFEVAETGFGTGLNFLCCYHLLSQINAKQGASVSLKYSSFEKYPLTKEDLCKALAFWPELNQFSEHLLAKYPEQISEDISIELEDGLIQLNIIIGDVNERIKQLTATDINANAWFLDGFAPSKNPDMWTQNLFENMARLSANDASLATFTAAGFVRRGLIDAGFEMKKFKGFGTKREMLTGIKTNAEATNSVQDVSND